MRIALVTDWFYPRVGGIEQHVLSLARRLRERGHDARVITPWPGPTDVGGIPVKRVPIRLVPGLGVSLNPWRLARRLRRVLQDGEYDVIHSHVSFGSTASMVRDLYRLACVHPGADDVALDLPPARLGVRHGSADTALAAVVVPRHRRQ